MAAIVARRPIRGPHDYEELPLDPSLEALRPCRPSSNKTRSIGYSQVLSRHSVPRLLPYAPTPRPPPIPLRSRPREVISSPIPSLPLSTPPLGSTWTDRAAEGGSEVHMTADSPYYGAPAFDPTAASAPTSPRSTLAIDTGNIYFEYDQRSIDLYHTLEHYPSPYDMATVGLNGYATMTMPNPSIFSPRPTSPPPNTHQAYPSSSSTVNSTTSIAPPITHPLPTTESLRLTSLRLDTLSDSEKIEWAQDVYRLADRYSRPRQAPGGASKSHRIPGPVMELLSLAVPIIISSTTHTDRAVSSLASYLKGLLLSSGICPDYLPKDPRQAFKEFENAARGGEHRGWFRLGRDYESVGDPGRARECLERGIKRGDCESTYRMGMAHLLGQLGLPSNPSLAISLLLRAAESSTIDAPHPAYVYGMLLAGELELPPTLSPIPAHCLGTNPDARSVAAREQIEKAAYLCHPPAQYKCGFMYEHAALGCPYDPLMSVQWYSLASQGGEVEADMALSKWFLCGADGNFGKNEDLARTFAEKSARKGHPNGCFAMGYYFELGIGGRKDTDQARKWYHRAAKLNNNDAIARLSALSAPRPTTFSLADHQARINDTLIRKRTLARIRSERQGTRPAPRRQDEERVWQDTQRAARAHHHDSPHVTMSPTPRVGEIMSPLAFQVPRLGPSTPSRRPIPHQAFLTYGDTTSSSGSDRSYPSSRGEPRSDEWNNGRSSPAGPRAMVDERTRWDSGPQTFAEMGFVSKPVQDEGCTVM